MLAKSVLVVVAVKTRKFFVLMRARFKVLFYDCNKRDATHTYECRCDWHIQRDLTVAGTLG